MAITSTYPYEYQQRRPAEVKIINNRAIRFRDVCVYEICMGDVEDPDLMVAQPIWEWQGSDEGRFVMENAVEKPYWTRSIDPHTYGHLYCIVARLSEQNEVFWRLKYVDTKN